MPPFHVDRLQELIRSLVSRDIDGTLFSGCLLPPGAASAVCSPAVPPDTSLHSSDALRGARGASGRHGQGNQGSVPAAGADVPPRRRRHRGRVHPGPRRLRHALRPAQTSGLRSPGDACRRQNLFVEAAAAAVGNGPVLVAVYTGRIKFMCNFHTME